MKINIALTNLGKYNEGELIFEWLELPTTEDKIKECLERIGISDEPAENGAIYEEYFITDYEAPSGVKIGEFENVYKLNEILQDLDDLEDEDAEALAYFGYDLDEMAEKRDDLIYYDRCYDMEDVAIMCIENSGILSEIPEHLQNYFDYEAFGRDMSFESHFYFSDNGCYELPY